MYPVDALFPVLNAPEALIIGVGRVGRVPPNETHDPTIEVVLVADHRAMGGAVAAKFLEELIAALESA
jgi:pyruvate/2-oxoglutarate dehydrogenase complex dihydrolipoamide acyltransferase (E2) component